MTKEIFVRSVSNMDPVFPSTTSLEPGGKPRLLGGRCLGCGCESFPAARVCASCLSEEISAADLSTEGTIYSFTTVHQAPSGFPTPYVLAYVDLTSRLRVLARIDTPADEVAIGQRVRLHVQRGPGAPAAASEPLVFITESGKS